METRELLILVPARAGSKGLPGKNAKVLGDLPLLGWTAAAIREARLGRDVTTVLSTDVEELASIGRSVGLSVPFLRPPELATDEASILDVALHCLSWFETERQTIYESIMLLQPTSPFRNPASIVGALQKFRERDVDGVVGVKRICRSVSTLFISENEQLKSLTDTKVIARRQEVEPLYTPNGALYLVSVNALRKERTFFPRRLIGLEMDQIASIDIDDKADWALAEAVVECRLAWRHPRLVTKFGDSTNRP